MNGASSTSDAVAGGGGGGVGRIRVNTGTKVLSGVVSPYESTAATITGGGLKTRPLFK